MVGDILSQPKLNDTGLSKGLIKVIEIGMIMLGVRYIKKRIV